MKNVPENVWVWILDTSESIITHWVYLHRCICQPILEFMKLLLIDKKLDILTGDEADYTKTKIKNKTQTQFEFGVCVVCFVTSEKHVFFTHVFVVILAKI